MTLTDLKLNGYSEEFTTNLVSSLPHLEDIKSKDILVWRCEKHGEYSQTVGSHLRGSGCPKCALVKKSRSLFVKKFSFNEYFLRDLEGSPDKDRVLNGELKSRDKALFVCKIHGFYSQTINDHRKGSSCPKCSSLIRAKHNSEVRRSKNPYPEFLIKDLHPDWRDKVKSGIVKAHDKAMFVCNKHGSYMQIVKDHYYYGCPTCGAEKTGFTSSYEDKLYSSLIERGVEVLRSVRNVIYKGTKPLELDLYLPQHKVAIEVNGLYYHSIEKMEETSRYNTDEGREYYHRMKTDLCREKGIQLIHLFEDDLRDKYGICFNLILSKCNLLKRSVVYARKCIVKLVCEEEASVFLNNNHIQGNGQGRKYGLFYNNELLSVMAVKHYFEEGGFELNRYATRSDVFVVGGFSKLSSFIEKDLKVRFWISYADLTVSRGDLYENEGWSLLSISNPDYKYVYKGVRRHKFNFRIDNFKNNPDLKYEEGLTELELAHLNNLRRIYDCGKMKYTKIVSNHGR